MESHFHMSALGLDLSKFKGSLNGKAIDIYKLRNNNGYEVLISNYGAMIVSFRVPDRNNNVIDITLGEPSISKYYENPTSYFGATVGRYCNRIANGKFEIDGNVYQLPKNNGPNNLHSGDTGFHNQVWDVLEFKDDYLKLNFVSHEGDNGYPGNVDVTLEYKLSENNELIMETSANADKKTIISITNHTFFNLNGGNCNALDAKLQIFADFMTPINKDMITTGEIKSVKGTNFDFNEPTVISSRINDENDQQLKFGCGYDHNFVLRKKYNDELSLAAVAYSEKTGIKLEVLTTLPGLQFYSGNFLDDTFEAKYPGTSNSYRYAFCLEAQYFPDTPNKPHFPSCIYDKDHPYHHTIIFKVNKEN